MRLPSCFSVRCAVLFFVVIGALASAVPAQEPPENPVDRFVLQNQVGVRLGAWSNLGSSPVADTTDGISTYSTDLKSSSFYLEAYFGYRLNPLLMMELAFGIVNRGDVTIDDGNGQLFYGNLLVYPIQLRAKLYPLASLHPKFQPYVMAGGGLYYGRNSIQFTTSSAFITNDVGASRTKFSYMLGGGVDWPLTKKVGLDLNLNYMPINFSKDLIFIRDYSSLTVTVGIKYLMPLRKK